MKLKLTVLCLLIVLTNCSYSYRIPGFAISPYFSEQVITFNYNAEIRIHINASSVETFLANSPVGLALYALPNGNTIEQTAGKVLIPGDDWHYDIQHIAAQTRFLRNSINDYNLVTVYLENAQKSWPAWKTKYPNYASILTSLVDYLRAIFNGHNSFVVLTGHSGGGRFNFCYLDAFASIPSFVKRIAFLDSNYGYEDSYGLKIKNWLNSSTENYLSVIAYNDSIALLNGQPIVSATGGTWYRSKMMKTYLSQFYSFTEVEDSLFIKYTALNGRIKIILKKNPTRAILHTVQVEKNGFIHTMLTGTPNEELNYTYYGNRAYSSLIQNNISQPSLLTIPPRNPNAKTGSQFMQYVSNMSFTARENAILNELNTGNIPSFLRNLKTINAVFNDLNGTSHNVTFQVMPDYLAIGHDSDYCRVPMGPITSQKFADLVGAVMPTRKLVDKIYQSAEIKLSPVTYAPVGNQNETVQKFVEHNSAINLQFLNAGGTPGQLTGGTKKDVVLSNKIIDPARPNHVVIYGWHQLNGQAIQPLTNIHYNYYVDYSHGIRLINKEFVMDNQVKNIQTVLKDAVLYKVLSDETGVMTQPGYIQSTTGFGSLPEKSQLPANLQLFDNYPNPFNSSTILKFSLAETSFIRLKIYDSMGTEIASLLNNTEEKGMHEIHYNPVNLASGIYFYSITDGNSCLTKKMIMLK